MATKNVTVPEVWPRSAAETAGDVENEVKPTPEPPGGTGYLEAAAAALANTEPYGEAKSEQMDEAAVSREIAEMVLLQQDTSSLPQQQEGQETSLQRPGDVPTVQGVTGDDEAVTIEPPDIAAPDLEAIAIDIAAEAVAESALVGLAASASALSASTPGASDAAATAATKAVVVPTQQEEAVVAPTQQEEAVVAPTQQVEAVVAPPKQEEAAVAPKQERREDSSKYYAVRQGKDVKGCVFMAWEDCKPHVEGFDGAKFKAFNKWQHAAAYARGEEPPAEADEKAKSKKKAHKKKHKKTLSKGGKNEPKKKKTSSKFKTEKTLSGSKKKQKENNAPIKKDKPPKPPKLPSKKWQELYERLKIFRDEKGDTDVESRCYKDSNPDKSLIELKNFVRDQRYSYRKFKLGEKSPMTNVKVERLNALGFDFQYVHPEEKEQRDRDVWEERFAELVEFKKTHNHCRVPKALGYKLGTWVATMRKEYKALRLGQKCRLTVDRMQRLNDLGFEFSITGPNIRWEDRIEQCKAFKAEKGHLCIPTSHPTLGVWTTEQRKLYQWFLEGKPTSMNAERMNQLSELGFVWQVGERRPKDKNKPLKTWEERFQQLLEFKEMHGHTVVPQHYPELGQWVHKQRQGYKKMKDGNPKTHMTAQKALKLADVGFVFDARAQRGGGALRGENGQRLTVPAVATATVASVAAGVGTVVGSVQPVQNVGAVHQALDTDQLVNNKWRTSWRPR